jgi:RNA polymerase sigma factor (sigma-70 family)
LDFNANFLGGRDDVGVMGSRESDAAVVADSVASPACFSLLYERHLPAVAGYLARRVGNELAEDLTAEVFVRAFRGRATFRPDHETALPWLLGIASHLVADHRRAERRRLATLQRLAGESADTGQHESGKLGGDLVGQLRRLPAADRDTLLLIVWGELSYEEAATALGVPVGTVRSRIARARRRLATAIDKKANAATAGAPPAAVNGETNA